MFELTSPRDEGLEPTLLDLARLASGLVEQTRRASTWGSPRRLDALGSLDRLAGALATARANLLVAERDSGASLRPGDRSFEAARARQSRLGVAEASRQVRQADAMVSMPVVAAAVQSGAVPLGHLDALARTASGAPAAVVERLASASGQDTVVQLARTQDAPEFARSLARLVATMDPAALERDHAAQRRERFLVLTDRPDGTFLRGRLDRVAGEVLRLAVESAGEVPGEDRSPQQAAADALVAVAERVLAGRVRARAAGAVVASTGAAVASTGAPASPGTPAAGTSAAGTPEAGTSTAGTSTAFAAARSAAVPGLTAPVASSDVGDLDRPAGGPAGGAHRPQVSLVVPIETLAALRAHERRDPRSPRDRAQWPPVAPATLEDGTPVPMSELARVLCDCEVTRVAVSAEGVPLDLGRTRRVYTGAHRRAVVVRDRQCAWNGCGKPSRWGEMHHIRWWDRDKGRTSVSNGVLLCVYHHHEVHRHDLAIERHAVPPRGGRDRGGVGSGVGPAERLEGTTLPARYTFRSRDGRVVNAPTRT